jgi:hypothetical protein
VDHRLQVAFGGNLELISLEEKIATGDMETTEINQELCGILTEVAFWPRRSAHDDMTLLRNVIDFQSVIELILFDQECFAIPVDDEDVTIDNFSSVKNTAAR